MVKDRKFELFRCFKEDVKYINTAKKTNKQRQSTKSIRRKTQVGLEFCAGVKVVGGELAGGVLLE